VRQSLRGGAQLAQRALRQPHAVFRQPRSPAYASATSKPVSTRYSSKVIGHPHAGGGSGSSTQSHWVSSPGGWSITATARPVAGRHGSHAGRRPRARIWRVIVG